MELLFILAILWIAIPSLRCNIRTAINAFGAYLEHFITNSDSDEVVYETGHQYQKLTTVKPGEGDVGTQIYTFHVCAVCNHILEDPDEIVPEFSWDSIETYIEKATKEAVNDEPETAGK